jgi:hypothetical protein
MKMHLEDTKITKEHEEKHSAQQSADAEPASHVSRKFARD